MALKIDPAHDKRSAILDAAQQLFDAKGYAATTMEAVAERAGIAKGSIYNYFRSKHDLFEHAFLEAIAEDRAAMDALLLQRISAREKLDAVLANWHQRLTHYARIGLVALEYWTSALREHRGNSRAETMSFAQLYAQRRADIAAVLRQGIESGEFEPHVDAYIAANLITALMDGLTLHYILEVGVRMDERFLDRMKRAVMSALTAAADADPRPAAGAGHE